MYDDDDDDDDDDIDDIIPYAPWLHLLNPIEQAWREKQILKGRNPDPYIEGQLREAGKWPPENESRIATQMPKGPQGQKRPADAIARAVKVAKIATGEIEDDKPEDDGKDPAAKSLGQRGGKARAEKMSPERRAEIAKQAATKRWGKK